MITEAFMLTQDRYRLQRGSRWGVWDQPVQLLLAGNVESIGSPTEALSLMSSRWPGDTNSSYRKARRECSNFFKRKASSNQVRVAFVTAAAQAGLLH